MQYRLIIYGEKGSLFVQYGALAVHQLPHFVPNFFAAREGNNPTIHTSLRTAIIGRDRYLELHEDTHVIIQYRKSITSEWCNVVSDMAAAKSMDDVSKI